MIRSCKSALPAAALLAFLSGCGGPSEAEREAPPPVIPKGGDVHSLQAGSYFVSSLRNLQDGCGKRPMGGTPITAVPFILTNDGNSNITMDFCSFDGRSVSGQIRGNEGTLAVIHQNRKNGENEFNQACRIEINITKDNLFEATYTESQSNRNQAMRTNTSVPLTECTTSFAMTMEKR